MSGYNLLPFNRLHGAPRKAFKGPQQYATLRTHNGVTGFNKMPCACLKIETTVDGIIDARVGIPRFAEKYGKSGKNRSTFAFFADGTRPKRSGI